MSIHSSTHKTYGKEIDKSAEKQKYRGKPRQQIDANRRIINKLVNLDPEDEKTFEDILKPEEAKAVEKIDDKSIFWAQIMRVVGFYTRGNFQMFRNAVEALDATLGSSISKNYKIDLRNAAIWRKKEYDKQVVGDEGSYKDMGAIESIETSYWLQRYKSIINELTRQGLWSLKGH